MPQPVLWPLEASSSSRAASSTGQQRRVREAGLCNSSCSCTARAVLLLLQLVAHGRRPLLCMFKAGLVHYLLLCLRCNSSGLLVDAQQQHGSQHWVAPQRRLQQWQQPLLLLLLQRARVHPLCSSSSSTTGSTPGQLQQRKAVALRAASILYLPSRHMPAAASCLLLAGMLHETHPAPPAKEGTAQMLETTTSWQWTPQPQPQVLAPQEQQQPQCLCLLLQGIGHQLAAGPGTLASPTWPRSCYSQPSQAHAPPSFSSSSRVCCTGSRPAGRPRLV